MDLKFLFASPFSFVGDETVVETETQEEEVTTPPPPPVKKKPTLKVALSPEQQDFVNSLLAEEKRKAKENTNKIITQLETLKNQVGTSAAEKERVESQIEELRSSHLTEKELTDKERKKQDNKRQKEIDDAKAEVTLWKDRFTKTQIRRAIVDAASIPAHKANNPAHIVALLSENTRLVEELDEEGKPTGEYVAKAKIRTVVDGKQATLDMIVTEAVKFLSEQDEHAGLFDSGAAGGLGGNPNRPRSKGGVRDPNSPPEDPAEYRTWREANRAAVGAPTKRSGSK